MKLCTKCKEYLTEDKFIKRGLSLKSHCRRCINKDNLNRYHGKDKSIVRKTSYRYNLKINYDLSEEEYNKLFEEQGGNCPICKEKLSNRFLNIQGKLSSIDHDHKTGVVRKILCMNCNSGLGCFNDNVDNLTNAIEYLHTYSPGH